MGICPVAFATHTTFDLLERLLVLALLLGCLIDVRDHDGWIDRQNLQCIYPPPLLPFRHRLCRLLEQM